MKKEKSSLRLISHALVLALVLLMAVASTFSWYDRSANSDVESYLLKYTQTGRVTGSGEKTVKTYAGTNTNGIITYSETELSADSRVFDVASGQACYFKTVITETDNAGASIVSLYLDKLTGTSNTVKIGIVGPEKTYKEYKGTSGAFTNICIEDNLLIESQGVLEVYWYIVADADGTVELGNFYTVLN